MIERQLEEVQVAIAAGDKPQARRLIAPILKENPSAEAWMLAARAMETDEQTVICLKKVLEYDPQHQTASQLVQALNPGNADDILAQGDAAVFAALGFDGASAEPAPEAPEPPPQQEAEKTADPNAEGVFEMLWDCQNCGATKLLGKTHKFCPHCGTPQDPGWRYFPADEDKVAVADHEYVGKDKTCASCGTLNSAASDFCQRCGAPLENAVAARTLGQRAQASGQSFEAEDLLERLHAERDAAVGRGRLAEPQKKRRSPIPFIILGVIIVLVAGAVFVFTRSEERTVTLVDYRWERTIQIEELRAVSGSSDCGSEPAGAYSIDRRYEQVDTRRVPAGEECRNVQVDQGDGTFRQERRCETVYENEPVMGYVCYYTVNRWQNDRIVQSDGNKSVPVEWPLTNVDNCNRVGCEREGDRDERYIFVLQDGDDRRECAVDKAQWDSTPIESVFTLEINPITNSASCSSLAPAS